MIEIFFYYSKCLDQCFSTAGTPGLEDLFTETWNIWETKNLSKITMKSSIFKNKIIRKIISPGLGPKKVENHCSKLQFKTPKTMLYPYLAPWFIWIIFIAKPCCQSLVRINMFCSKKRSRKKRKLRK